MAEEQRCQEGHRLCANNCGFSGSPATLNLCSKCYRDYRLKEDQANSAKIAVEKSLHAPSSSSSSPSLSSIAQSSESPAGDVNEGVVSPLVLTQPLQEVSKEAVLEIAPANTQTATAATTTTTTTVPANRCASCRKRVGLTGFRCRCGSTYCGAHRYAEQHACTFDFKSAGRDAIARANPLVKADKLGNKI